MLIYQVVQKSVNNFLFPGEDWMGVSLDEFMSCPSNLANNRQTRMLADLRLVNCYNTSGIDSRDRDRTMLDSAKQNLLDMAFFGLTELQLESQYMFERAFDMTFKLKFFQYDHDHASKAQQSLGKVTLDRIRELNALDIELYEFAHRVMLQRLEESRSSDPEFDAKLRLISERNEPEKDEEEEGELDEDDVAETVSE